MSKDGKNGQIDKNDEEPMQIISSESQGIKPKLSKIKDILKLLKSLVSKEELQNLYGPLSELNHIIHKKFKSKNSENNVDSLMVKLSSLNLTKILSKIF